MTGEFFKVRTDKTGKPLDREFYVEEVDPPDYEKLKEDEACVCTRTPWRTSLYGQIEREGIIKRSRLVAFKNTKKDKALLETLKNIQADSKRSSQFFYEMYKSMPVPQCLKQRKENEK